MLSLLDRVRFYKRDYLYWNIHWKWEVACYDAYLSSEKKGALLYMSSNLKILNHSCMQLCLHWKCENYTNRFVKKNSYNYIFNNLYKYILWKLIIKLSIRCPLHPWTIIKSQLFTDFIADWTVPEEDKVDRTDNKHWTMAFDGAFNSRWARAEFIFTLPTEDQFRHAD